jgi:phosphoribosylformimino-5-aminoimidazole carboxamide ribotide isomerase
MAVHWRGMGATRLHVVDLDGARTGDQLNAGAVLAILQAVDVPVELGGGIRDFGTITRWLDAGVERVYLGTAAVERPSLVEEACREFPGRIAAGADARDGRIAFRGWETATDEPVADFIRRVSAAGVAAVSYTDVSRDGTLEGPDIEGVRSLLREIPGGPKFIVAGGVGSIDHVLAVAAIEGVDGLIVGRALYDGTVDLAEALKALGRKGA